MGKQELRRGRRRSFLQAAGTLLYPGLVTIINLALVGLIGPLVFAIRADMHFPTSYVGVTYSLFFAASAIASSFGSRTLSRFRPAKIAQFGLAMSSLLCIATSFAWSSSFFVVASIIGGFLNGLATPAVSMVIVQTLPSKRRGLGLGVRVTAAPVATSLAAVGVIVVESFDASWRAIFVAYGFIGLLIFLVAVFAQAKKRDIHSHGTMHRSRSHRKPERTDQSTKGLGLLAVAGFFGATGTSFFPAFLVESLVDSGLLVSTAALLVGIASWVGIGTRLFVGGLSDRITGKTTKLWMMIIIMATALAGMIALALGTGTFVLGVGTFAALGIGWAWAGLIHHSAIELFPWQAARATSAVQTATFAGTVGGALLFGFMAQTFSFTVAWVAPLVSLTVTLILLLRVIRAINRRRTKESTPRQPGDVRTHNRK